MIRRVLDLALRVIRAIEIPPAGWPRLFSYPVLICDPASIGDELGSSIDPPVVKDWVAEQLATLEPETADEVCKVIWQQQGDLPFGPEHVLDGLRRLGTLGKIVRERLGPRTLFAYLVEGNADWLNRHGPDMTRRFMANLRERYAQSFSPQDRKFLELLARIVYRWVLDEHSDWFPGLADSFLEEIEWEPRVFRALLKVGISGPDDLSHFINLVHWLWLRQPHIALHFARGFYEANSEETWRWFFGAPCEYTDALFEAIEHNAKPARDDDDVEWVRERLPFAERAGERMLAWLLEGK